jgi:N-glycosylase/DNA lyase
MMIMEEDLIRDLNAIIMNSEVKGVVESRKREFMENRFGDERVWLTELTYCILVANTSAKSGLKCIKALTESGKLFDGSIKDIEEILKINGYRYPRKRAEYIIEARGRIKEIKEVVERTIDPNGRRDWLRRNVKGLGMKESSHFLRNMGYFDYAIIDRHILKILSKYGIAKIEQRKLTVKRYLELEKLIKEISMKLNVEPGILDLYLWYMDTGEVLK